MQLNYDDALRLKGQMIRFKTEDGQWSVGKVVKVRKDGLEIEEFSTSGTDGYGYGFWGPRPFFRPPVFVPFFGFGFSPFFFF